MTSRNKRKMVVRDKLCPDCDGKCDKLRSKVKGVKHFSCAHCKKEWFFYA